jgi:hypothetical protein
MRSRANHERVSASDGVLGTNAGGVVATWSHLGGRSLQQSLADVMFIVMSVACDRRFFVQVVDAVQISRLTTVTLGCLLPADPDCLREATVHQDTKPAPARSHSLLDWRRAMKHFKSGPNGTIPVGFSALME